jgi:hypothetical protein
MKSDDGIWQFTLVGALVLMGILVSVALVIAAYNIGSDIGTSWVVIVFQVVLTGCGVAVSVFLTYWICVALIEKSVERFDDFSREHEATLTGLKKRLSPIIAVTALIVQIVMIFADKVFSNSIAVVMVAILLGILFWIGNELMLNENLLLRITGWLVWFGAVALLPVAVMVDQQWTVSELWHQIQSIPLRSRLVFVLLIAIATLLPLALPLVLAKAEES